jgi:hypothetical protein
MTHAELYWLVINPRTGKGINERTLLRCFPEELADGKAKLKELLVDNWLDVVQNGQHNARWSAIEFGLRHINKWRDDPPGVRLNLGEDGCRMKITFVMPNSSRARRRGSSAAALTAGDH